MLRDKKLRAENETSEREQNYQSISDIGDIPMEGPNYRLIDDIPGRGSPMDIDPIAFNHPFDFKINFKTIVSCEYTNYNVKGSINCSISICGNR